MTNLEDFIKFTKEEEEISRLVETKQKDSRASEKDKADKELRKRAYETLKDIGEPGIDFRTETADTISPNFVQKGIQIRTTLNSEDSGRVFKDNTEDILNTINQNSLEEIALAEPISKKGEKGYDEVLSLYQDYLGRKKLVERYEKGQVNDPRELQIIRSGGAKKAENEIREKLKNKGYSKDAQNMAADLAELAAREGYINDRYVKEGAGEIVKEAEKKLRDYETSKDKKVIDYVKASVKNLAKGSTEEFETARGLIYQVETKKAA
ncbi:MAG: hypothetical protein Q7S27_00135 [Nanoarchaeota archaeon]|nr:hypothetical protein [Nanoarchaeota archaeon]